jgi:hypothetical protein
MQFTDQLLSAPNLTPVSLLPGSRLKPRISIRKPIPDTPTNHKNRQKNQSAGFHNIKSTVTPRNKLHPMTFHLITPIPRALPALKDISKAVT